MQLKLSQLVAMQQPLQEVMQKQMPIKAAYRLSRIAKTVDAELQTVEERRVELVKKYGEENGEGGYQVPPHNMVPFQNEYQELVEEVIDLDITPISAEFLEGVEISPASLGALEPILDMHSLENE